MDRDKQTRAFDMQLQMDHSPEKVWDMLVNSDRVIDWFPPKAVVAPGENGSVVWDWDELGKFDLKIHTWKPGKHLRLLEEKQDSAGSPVVHVLDFELQGKSGGTLLRLVHSGFGLESEWDDEFAGISSGWAFELRVLRHYLDHHQGKRRHFTLLKIPSEFSAEKTRSLVLGPLAFGAEVTPESQEGDVFPMQHLVGNPREAMVMVNSHPNSFAASIPGLDQAVFRYEREGRDAFIGFEVWGNHGHVIQLFEDTWKSSLTKLLRN